MLNPHPRQPVAAGLPRGTDVSTPEPSHIHIPRPSRLQPAVLRQPNQESQATAQVEPALEQAA